MGPVFEIVYGDKSFLDKNVNYVTCNVWLVTCYIYLQVIVVEVSQFFSLQFN